MGYPGSDSFFFKETGSDLDGLLFGSGLDETGFNPVENMLMRVRSNPSESRDEGRMRPASLEPRPAWPT